MISNVSFISNALKNLLLYGLNELKNLGDG